MKWLIVVVCFKLNYEISVLFCISRLKKAKFRDDFVETWELCWSQRPHS